jgi:hypothetical protein
MERISSAGETCDLRVIAAMVLRLFGRMMVSRKAQIRQSFDCLETLYTPNG